MEFEVKKNESLMAIYRERNIESLNYLFKFSVKDRINWLNYLL